MGTKGGDAMKINKARSTLYKLARLLGDVGAITKRKASKRVMRRLVGKATARGLRRMFK